MNVRYKVGLAKTDHVIVHPKKLGFGRYRPETSYAWTLALTREYMEYVKSVLAKQNLEFDLWYSVSNGNYLLSTPLEENLVQLKLIFG